MAPSTNRYISDKAAVTHPLHDRSLGGHGERAKRANQNSAEFSGRHHNNSSVEVSLTNFPVSESDSLSVNLNSFICSVS